MDRSDSPDVLIAGGGVAALEAALALRALRGAERYASSCSPGAAALVPAARSGRAVRTRRGAALRSGRSGRGGRRDASRQGQLVSVDAARHIAYTSPGGAVSYSMLLIACGAVPRPAVDGALTFRGPADTEKIEHLLAEIEAGEVRRVGVRGPGWGRLDPPGLRARPSDGGLARGARQWTT